MSGLFATLNTSKTGLFAQQQYINVTSHNISNAETKGYSRQNLILQTARPQTVVGGVGQVGTGVSMIAIERTRNQFLDYQIRKGNSNLGDYGIRYDYLSEVEGILNEPTDKGISELISQFFDGWHELSKNQDAGRKVTAERANTLAAELNNTYRKLNNTKDNAITEIQSSVFEISNTLDRLNSINKEIMEVTVTGNSPNDLLDRRDLLLDELSEKFGIDTRNQALNGIKCTPEGEASINLIRNKAEDQINKLAFVDEIKDNGNGTYNIKYYKNGDKTSENNSVEIQNIALTAKQYEELKQGRVIVTKEDGTIDIPTTEAEADALIFSPPSGKIGGLQEIYKDVDEYINQINTLAKALAFSVNAIHTEGIADSEKVPFFVNSDKGVSPMDYEGINAGNISINSAILENVMLIATGESSTSGSTDNTRALAMVKLRDFAMNLSSLEAGKKSDGTPYEYRDFVAEHFDTTGNIPEYKKVSSGTKLEGYFKNTINRVGVQCQTAKQTVDNQIKSLKGFLERRLSISGVSLDEEAINLVQFQHAFQANSKVITTVDQLLDVVINLVR
ncbi:flagellar hook-associated protein FlgK [Clostridium sp. UBA1056]|uniref:flagellar hook-associated protein FlgK n=1 Tax=unclassified Clostridium TaxID=2614128 RepID=UPI0032169571